MAQSLYSGEEYRRYEGLHVMDNRETLANCFNSCEFVEGVSLEQYFKPLLLRSTRSINTEIGTYEDLTVLHAFVHARRQAKAFIEELYQSGYNSRFSEIRGICMNLPCQEITEE